jgi:uncharacterized protein (DUF433 family)
MKQLTRITLDPAVMGGKACIRGLRVTVGTVVGLLAAGRSREEILKAYPYLEAEDIDQALAYAAWCVEPARKPREGWDEAFREMARRGDDALLDEAAQALSGWDEGEWEWLEPL